MWWGGWVSQRGREAGADQVNRAILGRTAGFLWLLQRTSLVLEDVGRSAIETSPASSGQYHSVRTVPLCPDGIALTGRNRL